jgi:two-component system chemotaxis sensor kinase CheA
MDDLLRDFIAETRETLEALSGEIVAWEAAPGDRARLDAIFRFVHTVKGSCGFVDLPQLQRLSHAAEDVLSDVRAGKRVPDRALVNAVLAVVDRIGATVDALDAGVALPHAGEDQLIAALAPGALEAAPSEPAAPPSQPRSMRLDVDLLDRMMGGMSDMVLARNELARVLREGRVDPAVEVALARLSVSMAEMREAVTRTRMQKIERLFASLPRMVRDTAAMLGKTVELTLEGSNVEIDRDMVEAMRDPLIHMIRNAIDHGIETAAERRAAGKPEAGQLRVAARQAGNQIVLEVSDDGPGIDIERLADKHSAAGDGRSGATHRGAELIFEPGLSVRDAATAVSGRGVGMDVVRAALDRIGGRIELDNRPGRGLRIQVQAPLMLSIIPAVLVTIGGQRFAIPRQVVEEIVTGTPDRIERHADESVGAVQIRARHLPLVDLRRLLEVESAGADSMLIVVEVPCGCFALAVDAVLDHQELVVKPPSTPITATGIYAGITLPDRGAPILMLDCVGIASVAGVRFDAHAVAAPLLHATATAQDSSGLVLMDAGPVSPPASERDDPPIEQAAEGIDPERSPEAAEPGKAKGHGAGTMLLDRQMTELIDVDWLLSQLGRATPEHRATGPLCLVAAPASGPLATFVGTLLEQHGYRVIVGRGSSEAPAVVLMTDAAAQADAVAERLDGAPVIRLRNGAEPSGPADSSIYRYDTGALLAAVGERIGTVSMMQ